MSRATKPEVFVVSDGRGETCEQLVQAALLQFDGQACVITCHSEVRTIKAVASIVKQAKAKSAVVFFTLVADKTRRAMDKLASEHLVPAVDVMGPVMSALHDRFKWSPSGTPGLFYQSRRDRFDRQSAIDYTLKHDDGQRPEGLRQAHVVLVGVSRAAKSSTCFYLAYEGIKAANVPLIEGLALPPQLLRLRKNKVIGLRINAMRLMTIRQARAKNLGITDGAPYLDQRSISREIMMANKLMTEHGWQSFDASYMAIEEVAKEVMRLRKLKSSPSKN